ncbi:putative phage protein (TIGR02218 family) [Angulomicrobium tetraedrale]|uniref:Putative phage protein (TIGR02218 family) n=1 Tax=Ancylobacter tetraedralis TaxID=217068 RepID=A0A839Z2C3_9HYPH|nr:DUF2163 domain-containing protein [Ancylobacter tetraedralis]MBB3769812.1 putative phage protein (TIGR02218 family) [Ancylobacter tetraedralis]
MRDLPAGLAAALATGATTLARCWRITRPDGGVIGITEHDEDLFVAGTIFRAAGGVTGSEEAAALGFSVGGGEMSAALSSDLIDEGDLVAGRYDGAEVELMLADWSAPSNFLRLRRGTIGEVRREGGAFTAELRALSSRLNIVRGRLFTGGCDADLGDARCKVALEGAYRGSGTVSAVEAASLLVAAGLDGFAGGWFTQGRLIFTSGANQGFACEVKTHATAGVARLELWQRPPEPLGVGDAFTVTAGCDKRFETCRDRFANALNFRGFPHMPGNDAVLRVAVPGG